MWLRGGDTLTVLRPTKVIESELESALALRQSYADQPTNDERVAWMRRETELEVARLKRELADATTGVLELSLDGRPVVDHSISVPYLGRAVLALQGAYRASMKSLGETSGIPSDPTLSLAATGPGSFKLMLRTAPAQLELLSDPLVDRSMAVLVDLLAAAQDGTIGDVGPTWAERADEKLLRSMIRLSATLASSRGTTRLRWRRVSGEEQLVVLTASAARSIAATLAGQPGREIYPVVGHLAMAQDTLTPRIRITTATAETYVADVKDEELLAQVRSLLFETVEATILTVMSTSPTAGTASAKSELLDIGPWAPPA